MKIAVFLPPTRPNVVSIKARAEGANGELGQLSIGLRPGEDFLGWSYDEMRQMGDGMHDIEPKPGYQVRPAPKPRKRSKQPVPAN